MKNDDDDDYGIATAMGVPAAIARRHVSAPVREDVLTGEGDKAAYDGYQIFAGAGRFYAPDEQGLVEAAIYVVSELGESFSVGLMDEHPEDRGDVVSFYREFRDGDGETAVTLTVEQDKASGLFRMALTYEPAREIYVAYGLQSTADAAALIGDLFAYSQG